MAFASLARDRIDARDGRTIFTTRALSRSGVKTSTTWRRNVDELNCQGTERGTCMNPVCSECRCTRMTDCLISYDIRPSWWGMGYCGLFVVQATDVEAEHWKDKRVRKLPTGMRWREGRTEQRENGVRLMWLVLVEKYVKMHSVSANIIGLAGGGNVIGVDAFLWTWDGYNLAKLRIRNESGMERTSILLYWSRW